MKFLCVGRFLGSEEKTSQKGNKYSVISFIQGTDTLTVMANDDVDVNYSFGDEVKLHLEYDVKYKNLKLSMIEN